jgi:hypothetical protein
MKQAGDFIHVVIVSPVADGQGHSAVCRWRGPMQLFFILSHGGTSQFSVPTMTAFGARSFGTTL